MPYCTAVRPLIPILVLMIAVAGCSSGTTDTTELSMTTTLGSESTSASPSTGSNPSVVLLEFLNALRDGDVDATAEMVDEPQILLLAAIEAGDPTLLEGVAGGTAEVDDQIRRNFWASFAAAVPGLADPETGGFEFSEPQEYTAEGARFQVVDAALADGTSVGTWVLRNEDGWIIDPIGSFGGPFVGPYTDWLQSLTGQDFEVARSAAARYRSSWTVLGDRQPLDEPGIAIGFSLEELFGELDA